MDKVTMCFERIRVIRGVNYGIITNEQIQNLFMLYQLDEEQKQNIFELLKNSNINPASEEEIPEKGHELNVVSQNNDKQEDETGLIKKQKEQAKCERRKKYFEEALRLCLQDIKDNACIAAQYQEEALILKNAIASQNDIHNWKASQRITKAIMEISGYRVRDVRKQGWVCGTYMSRVRECFERWIQFTFAEDELCELVNSCVENSELSFHQQAMILVLLHNTPQTLVHRYYTTE